VDTGIGPTLREARNRRKVDLAEVEAAIKIRVRYLRAMENEEWDALPGGAYTRGFIRTYASHLGLDGDRLAEDYRRATAPPGGERVPSRVEPVPTGARAGRSKASSRLLVAAVCLVLVALAIGIGLAGGGGDDSPGPSPAASDGKGERVRQDQAVNATRPGVTVRLEATAEVWVCLLGADERPLIDGQILAEGAAAGPFLSKGFEVALGNGSVTMLVDGEPAALEESSSPVGYRVDRSGELIALEEGERPDCE
jgi:cytoskeleton protein RodZ